MIVTAMATVIAAETGGEEGGVSPAVWGIGTFVTFMVLLLITLAFGRGRPHA